MADVQILIEPTPNPNSLKFTVDRPVIEKGSQSFFSTEQAEKSPLAKRLFGIAGVQSLFFLGSFVTVSRHPSVDWERIVPEVEEVLQDHFR